MKTQDTALIRVHNVKKTFETAAGTVQVLKNVDFQIPRGSFTIIYGSSGSGKSTLLNILMGLDAPTEGQVLYNGRDMYAQTADMLASFRASARGIVQQTNYWVKSLTVAENISMPLYFTGMDKKAAEKQAKEALELVGMQHHADQKPYLLSGGEQQRVAMARAMVHNPDYLLADEPTGNLDSKNGDAIIDLLLKSNRELGRTIVLVTHNLEYLPIGDQLLWIKDGSVTESGGKTNSAYTAQLMDEMKERIDKWSKAGKKR